MPKEEVGGWLAPLGLKQYLDPLSTQGYDDLQILRDMNKTEENELVQGLGMPVGHVNQFRRGLRQLRTNAEYCAGGKHDHGLSPIFPILGVIAIATFFVASWMQKGGEA